MLLKIKERSISIYVFLTILKVLTSFSSLVVVLYLLFMNASLFQKLSLSNKSSFLWKDGVMLCSRKTSLCKVHLYAINNLYVEVSLSHESSCIESIQVLDDKNDLDIYLADIPTWGSIT